MPAVKFLKSKIFHVCLFVFILSFGLRIWTLNQIGRTWDEAAYTEVGHNLITLIKEGKYFGEITKKNKYPEYKWFELPDPPPLARYVYGLASYGDVKSYDSLGRVILNYDLSYSRLTSALFFSLSTVFVVLIGIEHFSIFLGLLAGIIYSMLPFSLGLSQLATVESFIMFFFTSSVYSFIKLLQKYSFMKVIITGVLTGCAILTKYTNVLLFPLFLWMYGIWYTNAPSNKQNKFWLTFIVITLTSLIIFVLSWPLIWYHWGEIIEFEIGLRYESTKYSVPEVFFGKLWHVPKVYYLFYFVLTTPLLILILFFVGLYSFSKYNSLHSLMLYLKKFRFSKSWEYFKRALFINNEKGRAASNRWVILIIVAWFLLPFVQSFYNFRQHGLRYIIEVYAPLSLISALGADYIAKKLGYSTKIKVMVLFLITLYLFLVLLMQKPYYLDYFNVIAGGTGGVYESRMFQLGWWGQGLSQAWKYLQTNAHGSSSVGVPFYASKGGVIPSTAKTKMHDYKEEENYDFVIVSYFDIIRNGFNDSKVKMKYVPVYRVFANGATLIIVYKRK